MMARIFLWVVMFTLSAGYALSQTHVHNVMNAETKVMNKDAHKIVEVISLADTAYFKFSEHDALALQTKLADLLGEGPPPAQSTRSPAENDKPTLIAISAPKVVNLGQQDDLPILLATHETGLHRWQVKDSLNARVLVQDLDSGRVISERLLITPGKRMMTPAPSGSGPKPDAINAASTLTGVRRYFLRNLLGIDWRPGRLAVTVVFYDLVSNTVVVELKGHDEKPMRPQAMAPSEFLQAAVQQADELPDIALSVPAQATGKISVRGKVKAAIRLLATAPSATQKDGKVLLASLLMVKIDDDDPLQIDLVVPVVVLVSPGPEQLADATFRFDAGAVLAGKITSGIYQTYLIAGARIVGPYPLLFQPH